MFNRSITKALSASLVAAVATFALSPAAQAQDVLTRTAEVSYSGLDLTSTDGVATFNARIKRAARAVCSTGNRLMLAEKAQVDACERGAIANASEPAAQAIAMATGGDRTASARGAISVAAR